MTHDDIETIDAPQDRPSSPPFCQCSKPVLSASALRPSSSLTERFSQSIQTARVPLMVAMAKVKSRNIHAAVN